MASKGAKQLGDVARQVEHRVADPATTGGPDEMFQYLEIADIDTRDGFALAELVERSAAPSRARLRLPRDAVVLSSVRPARNAVAYIGEDLADAVGSTGLIVLEATEVPPELLFLLLKSRSVVSQLDRRARASMYPALHPPDISDVRLPSFSGDDEAHLVALVRNALAAKATFIDEIDRTDTAVKDYLRPAAATGLHDELGTHEPQALAMSSVASAGRLDAEFHAPPFRRLEQRMRSMGATASLAELVAHANTGKTPPADGYADEDLGAETALVKVASLSNHGIIWPSVAFAGIAYKRKGAADLRDGDVIFTSSAHALAHIARKVDVVRTIPTDISARLSFVGELMRLRLKEDAPVSPEYLAAFIRHPVGGLQVRRTLRGITSHVYPNDVLQDVIVPIPPKSVNAAITKSAAAAQAARTAFRMAIAEALRLIEPPR